MEEEEEDQIYILNIDLVYPDLVLQSQTKELLQVTFVCLKRIHEFVHVDILEGGGLNPSENHSLHLSRGIIPLQHTLPVLYTLLTKKCDLNVRSFFFVKLQNCSRNSHFFPQIVEIQKKRTSCKFWRLAKIFNACW